MITAKETLKQFNKLSFAFELLLIILFFSLGVLSATFILPSERIVEIIIHLTTAISFFIFGFISVKLAENVIKLIRLKLEDIVESKKTEEEKAVPIVVSKKSVSAQVPPEKTLSNKVLRTTTVVLKPNRGSSTKRGRPVSKKES